MGTTRTVGLRMPWGEIIKVSGKNPDEAYENLREKLEERDRSKGSTTFWDPKFVKSQIERYFVEKEFEEQIISLSNGPGLNS